MPEIVYRSVGSTTSTAVIWFMVSVPVLSELIAEVNPSVSTEGRSLTIALRLARSTPPSDRMVWVTVGRASGMAAMASETAATNRWSQAWPRARPRTNMTIIVRPAAAAIHSVSRLSSRVSGDSSRAVADSIPEILPSSVPAPVPVTITVALPCVTGLFMNAMFDCSPGPSWSPGSVAASLAAGTLSPVSADSSICSALDAMIRPSAGTWSPAEMRMTSPTTSSSAGISDSAPSRRTRAVAFIIDLSAFIALSALPSCRRPTTAFSTVRASSSTAVLHSLISKDTTAAAIKMICM